MTNPFYTATGAPVQESRGTSPAVRNEFALLQTAFDEVFDAIDIGAASGTSTTSLTIGTGTKSLTTQTGLALFPGQSVSIAYTTSPSTRMLGVLTSYDTVTGAMVIDSQEFDGSGTYAAWTIALSPTGQTDLHLTLPSLALSGTTMLTFANSGRTGDVAAGAVLTMDTLATLGDGWFINLVPASTSSLATLTADFGSGSETRSVAVPVQVSVKKVGSTYTVRWTPLGPESPAAGAAGSPADIYSSTSAYIASAQLSPTRTIALYTGSSGYPRAALLSNAAVLSTSSDFESVAMSGATPQITRISSTEAVAIWSTASAVKASILRDNAGAIAFTAPTTLEAVASTCQTIATLTATSVQAAYSDTTNSRTRAMVLTLSGSPLAITTNTGYTISSGVTSVIRSDAISSTQVVYVMTPTSSANVTQALVTTEASTALTFPASLETICNCGSANNTGYADVAAVGGSRVVVVAGNDAVSTGRATAFVMDSSGTGTAALLKVGAQRPIHTPGNLKSSHRLRKVSATTLLHLASVKTSGHSSIVQALYIEGDAVRPGASKSLARNVSAHDLAYYSGNSAMTVYVDADASSHAVMLPFDMGGIF